MAGERKFYTRDKLFIGGRWVEPAGERRIALVDPTTGQTIGSVPEANEQDVDAAIAAAVDAFRSSPWRRMTFTERADVLERFADEVEARADDVADAYADDFGGLHSIGVVQAVRSAELIRANARWARELPTEPERRAEGGIEALITREPVGPVLGIVPWNSTFPITIVKIAPALVAGCPMVVKIANESPLTAFVLGDAIEAAGFPEGLISLLPGPRERLGDITGRPEFQHITFTGSTAAGISIMKQAAENVTAVTLELGGKSAGIILPDMSPEEDAALVHAGTMGQYGQICTTYSRLLVPRESESRWRAALVGYYESLAIGDPRDPNTAIGPLVTAAHRDSVERYIQIARDEGATILTGGSRPSSLSAEFAGGFFLEPTLIADVEQSMRIVREEVFGPVITIQAYDTIEEAIELANDSDFGLAGGIYTRDMALAMSVAAQIEAGSISINLYGACTFMPFGGYKKSGIGREGGPEAIDALLEYKQLQLRRT